MTNYTIGGKIHSHRGCGNKATERFVATDAPVNCKRCLGIREERTDAPVAEKAIKTISAMQLTEGMTVMVKGGGRKVISVSNHRNGEALIVRVRIGAQTKTFPVRKSANVKVQG